MPELVGKELGVGRRAGHSVPAPKSALGAVVVYSPPGGTGFSQYPLAFPLELKRLKRDNKEGR